jgi:hypothetical protein
VVHPLLVERNEGDDSVLVIAPEPAAFRQLRHYLQRDAGVFTEELEQLLSRVY